MFDLDEADAMRDEREKTGEESGKEILEVLFEAVSGVEQKSKCCCYSRCYVRSQVPTFDCGRSSFDAHSNRDDDCVIVPFDMLDTCVEARLCRVVEPPRSSITSDPKKQKKAAQMSGR